MKFTFKGIQGNVDRFGFVTYGGMGFQITAASDELRRAIKAQTGF